MLGGPGSSPCTKLSRGCQDPGSQVPPGAVPLGPCRVPGAGSVCPRSRLYLSYFSVPALRSDTNCPRSLRRKRRRRELGELCRGTRLPAASLGDTTPLFQGVEINTIPNRGPVVLILPLRAMWGCQGGRRTGDRSKCSVTLQNASPGPNRAPMWTLRGQQ